MKKALLACITFLAVACSRPKEEKPADLIPADTMANVLVDIHIAEASMPAMQIYGEKMNEVALEHYDHIYQLHNVTEERFKVSYDYYLTHPKEYEEVYDDVVKKLEKIKSE